MMDIDKFKNLNDTYGHNVGDEILIMVSKTINEAIEEKDVFGRIGGEEFALLFISSDPLKAEEKVNVIRKKIEALSYKSKDSIVSCTISNGIAKKTKDDLNIDTVLARADQALYEAKGTGRNKVVSFRA